MGWYNLPCVNPKPACYFPAMAKPNCVELFDEEIRKVVMTGYDCARTLIETNRDAVRLMAEELLQNESLEADEIRALLERAGARA